MVEEEPGRGRKGRIGRRIWRSASGNGGKKKEDMKWKLEIGISKQEVKVTWTERR